MEMVFRICLFLVGLINALPALLAVLPERITSSYGVEIPGANYELLLRHRAVLFGIVGGLVLYSAIVGRHYALAVTVALVSMGSFLLLYQLANGPITSELGKVALVDLVGIAILLIGYGLYRLS